MKKFMEERAREYALEQIAQKKEKVFCGPEIFLFWDEFRKTLEEYKERGVIIFFEYTDRGYFKVKYS